LYLYSEEKYFLEKEEALVLKREKTCPRGKNMQLVTGRPDMDVRSYASIKSPYLFHFQIR